MSKFKNCFATANDMRDYDIVIDGEIVAKAHTLTIQDKAEIERKSISKTHTLEGMKIDINSNMHMLYTVLKAIDSWIIDEPLNEENLGKHPMLPQMFNAVNAHEETVAQIVLGNEKN
jgi:hypothetical protein